MDAQTKELKRTFPITHLRRWAPGNRTFTLDFGEYEDDYLTVQTLEGEAISQLIAGYIDIILKRTRNAPRLAQDDDFKTAEEISVAPIKAMGTEYTTAPTLVDVVNPSGINESMINPGMRMPGVAQQMQQTFQVSEPTMGDALRNIDGFIREMKESALVPDDFNPQYCREEFVIKSQGVLSKAAQFVQALSSGQANINGLAGELAFDIGDIIRNARNLANSSDQDISLIPGAMAVSEAINRILQCGKNLHENPNDQQAQMAMKIAQSQLKAAQMFLKASQAGILLPAEHSDLVLASANALASACDRLFAQCAEYSEGNPKLNGMLTYSKTLGDGLMYSARTLAPAMGEPECYQQVATLSSALSKSCATLLQAFRDAGIDPGHTQLLNVSTSAVSEAIRQLLMSGKLIPGDDPVESLYSATLDISKHGPILMSPSTEAQEIINSYKELAKASSQIVNSAKEILAAHPRLQGKLLPSLKNLAVATRSLFAAAKSAAQSPSDTAARSALAQGTRGVISSVAEVKSHLAKEMAFAGLRRQAILTASNTTGLITTSSIVNISEDRMRNNLDGVAGSAKDGVIQLVRSIAEISRSPSDSEAQLLLLNNSRAAAHPTSQLIAVSKQALRKIDDGEDRKELTDACNNVSTVLQALLEAINAVDEIGGGREIKDGLEELENMSADLEAQMIAIDGGFLTAPMGQNRAQALNVLGLSVKTLGDLLTDLSRTAATDPSKVGEKATACTEQVNQVVQASKTIAALTRGKEAQKNIINSATDLTAKTRQFFSHTKNFVMDPENLDLGEPMEIAKKNTEQSAISLMNAARGINSAQINTAIESISQSASRFTIGEAAGFAAGIATLRKSIASYSATASQVVSAAMTNPKGLGSAASMASQATPTFIDAANCAAGLFSDRKNALAFLQAAREVTDGMLALINQATSAAAADNPNSADLRRANLDLNSHMKDLINIVKPGQADITEAIDIISNAVGVLDSDDPLIIGSMPLWELHQAIKKLAENSSGIMSGAREQSAAIGVSSKNAAIAVNDLINASRLVVNPQENPCTVVASKIINAANALQHFPGDRNKVIMSTKNLANLTKEAISAAKEIRGDAQHRATIVQCSQTLGRATGQLGAATKALAMQQAGADQQVLAASKALREQAESFRQLSLFKDKQPVPVEVSNSLFNATRSVSTATSHLISAASSVADDPSDFNADSEMSGAVRSLQDSISTLQNISSTLAAGAQESTDALRLLQKTAGELDAVGISIAAGVDLSDKKPNASIQDVHTTLVGILRDLATETQNLVKNTVDTPENVGSTVLTIANITEKIGKNCLDVVYGTQDKKVQTSQVNKAKDVVNAAQALIQSAKKANVNPADSELIDALTDSSQVVKDSITALGGELQGGMVVLKECDDALRALQASLRTLNTPATRDTTTTYQDCQKNIKGQTRLLANGLSNLATTSSKNPDQIGIASKELTELVSNLIDATRAAAATTNLPEVQKGLLTSVMNVAKGAAGMIQNSKKLAENSGDVQAQSSISQGLHNVTNAVSDLLSAVKLGATAERDIELAVENISKVKVDLDSAALFAASGQFSASVAEGRNVEISVSALKETLNSLTKNSSSLVDAAKGYQEQFAAASKNTAAIIDQMSTLVKETASLLPDLMSQQSVLTGGRAVTIAVQQMVLAGKDAQANPLDSNAQKALESSIEAVGIANTQLVSLSDTASADLIVTIRELQKAIREIRQAVKNYENDEIAGDSDATPATIFESAKGVVSGNGQLLSTYGSAQEDFIKAIQDVNTHCTAMIHRSKGARALTKDSSIHSKLDKSLKASATAIINLFESGKLQRIDDPAYYKQFSDASEACTGKLNELVSVLKVLPGGKDFSWEDDDTNIAETELQAAIAAIEAAKNRLLDPSQWGPGEGGIDLGEVAQQIVEATKCVAVATQQLVVTATDVQNEIVSQGRASSKKMGQVYKKDPAWEEGLISAAKAVAGTTEDLVGFANQSVKGECGEEMLVACVRGVGGATARLVSAAKAKADPFSDAHKSLGTCAKKVAEATQGLAAATKAATEKKVEAELKKKVGTGKASFAGLRAKELEEQARIAKLELELERARQNLFQNRKKEYQS
eukprot:CAMPEP_0117083992 /NCGR_PEP_ID=MMETSP0472-20121206/59125_1 /TAXON_ID=693140 ORGANISM="Tiarina fusus, Strain LIS" /NCGR_SAMPLE_ID=MMETSP0472 /ASSEMBLY_ACC=CAM_ASM_000603 /LENGTH=2110 /DNA_ID=CAMNT_0004812821 /DNA_START=731 /DNA_END=7063 /DNA_ORIENTATION=-